MNIIIRKKCKYCNKRPNFNFEGENKGVYCSIHKEENMVDVSHKKCCFKGCKKQPIFNYEKETKALYCSIHKEENMVDVKNKRCLYENCLKRPNFNFEGEIKSIYCSLHKYDNMVDINNKKCEYIGCKKNPTYSLEGDNKRRFCVNHKEDNMVNVSHKSCIVEKCLRRPIFNFKGETKALYCNIHKEKNMIDITHNKCNIEHCLKRPNFNFEGKTKALYCSIHKEDNMIDITHTKCDFKDCKTRATFGYVNQKPSRCSSHKDKLMFLKPTRKCIGNDEEECKEIAIYGKCEPEHCEEHSYKEELCLIGSKCSICFNIELLNRNGKCIYCEPNESYKEYKTFEKRREKMVLKYLDDNLKISEDIKIIDDKVVDRICNLYRPDRVYDCGTHIVVVEIDENQHKYRSFCDEFRDLTHAEESRMYHIQAAQGLPCIFFRFNPDNYKVNNITQKTDINNRLKLLVKWIHEGINKKVIGYLEPITYIKIFYDEYDSRNTTFKTITEKDIV